MSRARYRILAANGEKLQDGEAEVEVRDGILVLAPDGASVLPIPFVRIETVTEPEPFTVRLTLAGGDVIELGRLGAMRTQLLAELRDGRGDAAAAAAGAVGEAEVFAAGPSEVRVYDDALLVTGDGGSERVSFSFAGEVRVQSPPGAVTVEVAGRDPVVLTRLGRRTTELAGLLTTRIREASVRTAAFLAALLPGLDPMAVRAAAGLLRDGVAVPAADLDSIHPGLAGTLITLAALPDRRDAVACLGRQAPLAVGFRQLASVRRPAAGVEPWHDHAAAPHIGEHESTGGAVLAGWPAATGQPGLAGVMAAGVMAGGPGAFGPGGGSGPGGGYGFGPGGPGAFGYGEGFGAFGGYWAFRALGAGMNGRGLRPMAVRPDVTRGLLTPATEDLSALAVTGESPTVLAFVLAQGPGGVAYEVLNRPEPVTYVFRGELAAVNQALDDAGFDPGALASRLVPGGQVPHDEQWPERIAALLAG
ncbi:MAG TPA: hypothetical protein VFW50_16975 [Streptosporangiaceae bacterium]|nr:hypothetical protein [Streptosporangiaceae bacterium]